MDTYKVVFWGKVMPNQTVSQVAKRFAAAFNLRDQASLKQLFSGKVITLKKGLSYDHAKRYCTILSEMGAECCLEKEFNPLYSPSEDPLTRKRHLKRPSLLPNTDLSQVGITPKESDEPKKSEKIAFI